MALLALSTLLGCNLNRVVAKRTAALLEQASPAIEAHWDYELVGAGMPSSILQLEALSSVAPNDERLCLNLAKAYVAYAQGWIENDYEVAWAAGNFDRGDLLRVRARLLYQRARALALRAMRVHDDGIDQVLKSGDVDKVAQYLAGHYTDRDDIAPVFWAGTAWGALIGMSLDQLDVVADAPVAKLFVERAHALDPMYQHGASYVFLGSVVSSLPAALGGDPETGKQLFEQGLSATRRRNHMMLVKYARVYAVNTQNRALYEQLLTEVINAKDQGDDVRLANKIARVRAVRYLAQGGELF